MAILNALCRELDACLLLDIPKGFLFTYHQEQFFLSSVLNSENKQYQN